MKWIFFDLDDTLFDFSRASLIALESLWREESSVRSVFSTSVAFIDEYHIHNSRMWQLHEAGRVSSDFLKSERFRLTLAPDRSDEATLRLSRRLNDRYLDLLGECDAPVAGAKELLTELRQKYLIGVLSNGFKGVQYKKLVSSGLDRFIQRVVISEEIGIQKPDTRLFRYAEEATGADASTAIMVGDNPANDVQGAIDAGWRAVYFDCRGKPFESASPLFLGKVSNLNDILSLAI